MGQEKSFYFWRTYDGQEIDLVEESELKISAFEFKWSDKMPRVPKLFQMVILRPAIQLLTGRISWILSDCYQERF